MPKEARDHDLTLFGATGFVGRLVAARVASVAPPSTRLALAGRDLDRLAALRDELGRDTALVKADVDDPSSLASLARATRVLATTVGPYLRFGDGVVGACAAAGTDYLDLTGEPEFVDLSYLRHHGTAERSGARLVHACGFDSIPTDLGVQFTVAQLPEGVPIAVRGDLRARGVPSGGTLASALGVLSRLRAAATLHQARRRVEGQPADRRVRAGPGGFGPVPGTGWWALPLPVLDPQIVERSAAALPRYGPDFSYRHHLAAGGPLEAAAMATGAGVLAAGAQFPAVRTALAKRLPAGTGPDEARRARSWFTVRFTGSGGGERVVTEVSGGDPGYGETAVMFSEAALCLCHDDLPDVAGQVTTAQALGEVLRSRLVAAGLAFRVR